MLSTDTYRLQPRLFDGERTLVIKPDYVEYDEMGLSFICG